MSRVLTLAFRLQKATQTPHGSELERGAFTTTGHFDRSPEAVLGLGGMGMSLALECFPFVCSGGELKLAARTGRLNPEFRGILG